MKRYTLFATILICFSALNLFGAEVKAKLEYNVVKVENESILKIKVILVDKTAMNQDGMQQRQSNFNILNNFEEVKQIIINKINENNSLEVIIKRPEYIDEIFELIQNQDDKNKAIRIFNENNFKNAVQLKSNNSVSVVNGNLEKKVNVELIIPIKIDMTTNVTLEPIKINYGNNVYITEKVVMQIVK